MAGLLSALKQRHPELAVALTIDNSAVLAQKLNAGSSISPSSSMPRWSHTSASSRSA